MPQAEKLQTIRRGIELFKDAGVLFLYTETPLHAGSGSSLKVVDLPIQRERHTNFPIVQSGGIKGVFRDEACQQKGPNDTDWKKKIKQVFGPEEGADEHAGALAFTDAKLLLFPVRSLKGVFAWITCPTILHRMKREFAFIKQPVSWKVPSMPSEDRALVCQDPKVAVEVRNTQGQGTQKKIVLEEFAWTVDENDQLGTIAQWISQHAFPPAPQPKKKPGNPGQGGQTQEKADDPYAYWRNRVASHLVLLGDDDFTQFVTMATEVISRIRIDDKTGVVERGALWNEEHLPSESLLYTLTLATEPRGSGPLAKAEEVLGFLGTVVERAQWVQIGGDETVGRGIVRVTPYALKPTSNQQGGGHAHDKRESEQQLADAGTRAGE